jgi:hypothetical protein
MEAKIASIKSYKSSFYEDSKLWWAIFVLFSVQKFIYKTEIFNVCDA